MENELYLVIFVILCASMGGIYVLRKHFLSYFDKEFHFYETRYLNEINSMKTKIADIYEKQRSINEKIELLEKKFEQFKSQASNRERRVFGENKRNFLEEQQTSIVELVDAYNRALYNNDERHRFRETYQIERIGVQNAMERRRDANLEPVFQNASDGDYFAIVSMKGKDNCYPIVPRFDLIVQDSNYKAGALGEIYRCIGFETNKQYRKFRLVQPAYFSRIDDKTWKLEKRGEIHLNKVE